LIAIYFILNYFFLISSLKTSPTGELNEEANLKSVLLAFVSVFIHSNG
jgi:hypothetical protein